MTQVLKADLFGSVSLSTDGRRILVNVEDNGVGLMVDVMGARATKGFGLLSIRERLEPLGGTLEIRSQPNQGSRMTLSAPLVSDLQ